MSVRTQSGRRVPVKRKNSMVLLFVILGVVVVAAISLVAVGLNRPAAATVSMSAPLAAFRARAVPAPQ